MAHINAAEIVLSTNFLNQTAAITETTLFTPTLSSLYRISAFREIAPSSSTSVSISLDYTNSYGVFPQGGDLISTELGGVAILFLTAGNPLQFHTSIGTGTISYNLYFVVEQF